MSELKYFKVEALENFLARTTYHVAAKTERRARELCRDGLATYDAKEILDCESEWVDIESVEEQDPIPDEVSKYYIHERNVKGD